MYFDDNKASNVSFNEKMSTSHDNTFGMDLEPLEASMNNVYITSLEERAESVGFKIIITKESHADVSLMSSR